MTHASTVIERGHEAQASPRHKRLWGIYFPEDDGAGYLLISYLAKGAFGEVTTVLSLADNTVLVRKQETLPAPSYNPSLSVEVSHYVSHPNIPGLISYREYEFRRPHNEAVLGIKTSTTWSFCNGGSMENLLHKISEPGTNELARRVRSDMPPTMPEAFVYKAFDTMLSVLIHIHNKGVVHNDLHDGNIYLHWPDTEWGLPEVFVGDFGLSRIYPWVSHPQPELSVPFQIASYNDIPGPQLSPESEVFDISTTAPALVDGFGELELRAWYNICRNDYLKVFEVLGKMVTCSPCISVVESNRKVRDLWLGNGVNGFSQELLALRKELRDIIERSYGDFEPSVTMGRIRQFHARVHSAAQKSQAAFGDRTISILNTLRPPTPQPQPATWPTPAIANYGQSEIVVTHTDPHYNVVLDRDQFEVRRIRQISDSKWELVSPDEDSDSDNVA